jgi:hypothetical protein
MKAIFIVLNAVLGAAFLVIFLTPLLLLGSDWFDLFWTRNWPIAIVFMVTLGAVDTYFLLNWRLFQGLEKEDWASVAGTLEHRIVRGGPVMASNVRILLNTYLVTSNTDGILALEAYLRKRKGTLIPRFSLAFGIPHLLSGDAGDAEAFFRTLLSQPRLADRDWVKWDHAFSLLQARKHEEARRGLDELSDKVSDPVLLLLSLYLLDVLARNDAALESRVAARRERLSARHTPALLQKAIEKSSGNMQVVVFSRLLQDAARWLYAGGRSAAVSEEIH